MISFPVFHQEDTLPVVAIFTTAAFYLAYWYAAHLKPVERLIRVRMPEAQLSLIWIMWRRTMGMLFLGFIPILIFSWMVPGKHFIPGLSWDIHPDTLTWIGAVGGFVILVTFFTRHAKENLESYPQIRIQPWTLSIHILNIISWTGFLLAYEFLFRGILFFSVYESWGFWPSITINTTIYSLVHFPKGRRETLGAIPLGFLMCYITFKTGSVWAAFGIHLIMAVSNDYFSKLAQPEHASS